MQKASGILKRSQAPDGWAASDLALRPRSRRSRAGKSAAELDVIIVGTGSPD
jgi:hypothetical protein